MQSCRHARNVWIRISAVDMTPQCASFGETCDTLSAFCKSSIKLEWRAQSLVGNVMGMRTTNASSDCDHTLPGKWASSYCLSQTIHQKAARCTWKSSINSVSKLIKRKSLGENLLIYPVSCYQATLELDCRFDSCIARWLNFMYYRWRTTHSWYSDSNMEKLQDGSNMRFACLISIAATWLI